MRLFNQSMLKPSRYNFCVLVCLLFKLLKLFVTLIMEIDSEIELTGLIESKILYSKAFLFLHH